MLEQSSADVALIDGRTASWKLFFIGCDSARDLAPVRHVSLYARAQIEQGVSSMLWFN